MWTNKVRRWLAVLLGESESLLSRRDPPCLICGTPGGEQALPVCRLCWAKIPWIADVRCSVCGRPEECQDCLRRERTYYTKNRSVVRYNDHMKEWLALYKYRGKESMREVIGPMLQHAYRLHRMAEAAPAVEVLSYVPLSRQRFGERGFNQAEQLARELGQRTNVPVLPLLLRTQHTGKQSFKSRSDRLRDLRGVFAAEAQGTAWIREACRRGPVRVYLIDDVYTTGSTLNECARTIREAVNVKAPVEVCGISWAR
ncbi:ComF family protein [Paenibacillus mucilaginosus]|uniref:ComFC n=2 Tax=Paenibacillus mucilaginosus TaxID=61624 RepID=F8FJ35_PAEMK|nr:ComF family protein [Paenibacillus mucilaginosus]AEI38748.1 ComFC [Paenibacillus mucilaginosus KNP414]WDM27830.1 ComF family protein [Paenibacillus mucilaginosus]